MLDLRGEKYEKLFCDTQFVKLINIFFVNKILSAVCNVYGRKQRQQLTDTFVKYCIYVSFYRIIVLRN